MDTTSLLLDASGEILMLVDEKTLRIRDVNRATLELLGYARDFLIDLPVGEIECALSDMFFWDEVIARRGGGASEGAYRCADGTILEVTKTASLAESTGNLFAVRANPVGLRKRIKEELMEMGSRLSATLEATADGILLVGSEGAILNMNHRFSRMWGVPKSLLENHDDAGIIRHIAGQIKPKPDGAFVLPMQLQDTDDNISETLYLQDGRVFELTSRPARSAGQHIGWVHSYHDVTEQKRSEELLRVAAIVFESQVGMLVTDDDKAILRVNHAFTNVTGYDAEEVLGQNPDMLNAGLQDEKSRAAMWEHIVKYGNWEGEIQSRRKNGEIYPQYFIISAVKDSDNVITNYVATISDITERKKAEAAQAASRSKSEFLANMSHEIRTPMNGVIGMLDILRQTRLDPKQQRIVSTIQDSSLALLNILNDILDFSKVEAGMLEVERIPTHLREAVESVAQLMFTTANTKSVSLFAFVSPLLPRWIASDPTRLRQVLLNLLGNAIKFTSSQGGRSSKVVLRAEPATLADGRPSIQLRVIDNGIGMSPETQAKLFQPFSQADESTSRKFGGTGLGLSITQRLVELMGGRISVYSTLGEGTEFIVELPLEETAPGRQLISEPDLTGVRVLAVTGEAACTETLTVYCGAAGADITVVADLAAARMQLLQEQPSPTKVVLLLGLDAPAVNELDLPDTTRVVRLVLRGQSTAAGKAVPVHTGPLLYRDLIFGVALASGRLTARDSVMLTDRRQQPRVPLLTVKEALAARRLILLAEDNETNREVIREQLNLLGYTAETAEDGVVALSMWRTGRYALLLTDCHMPNMDGFELTETIRNDEPPGTHLPIIAVTANALQGEAERCMEHGMDDYLSKPLRLAELGAMLDKWLPQVEAILDETAGKPSPWMAETTRESAKFPVWDAAALIRMVGNNPGMHRRLLEKFLVNAQEQVAAILYAAAAGDTATVGSVAHTFKSAARTVGAMQLGELCQDMEMAGKAGDGEACNTLAGELSRIFEAAAGEIKQNLNGTEGVNHG